MPVPLRTAHCVLILLLATGAAVLAVDSLPPPSEQGQSLWGLISQGGWAMYPLGLCCLATLFLIIYCWRETSRERFVPDSHLESLSVLLYSGDLDKVGDLLEKSQTVLSRSLLSSLAKARTDKPDGNRDAVEDALGDTLETEESSLAQWINYLNVVATVSPMIGLLGTVSGMIGAFQTIARGGMGRPELLAGDIGEALITTATGLVIGIPAMIAFFILRNRLNNQMLVTTQTGSVLVDYLAGEIVPETVAGSPAESVEEGEAVDSAP